MDSPKRSYRHHHRSHKRPPPQKSFVERIKQRLQDAKDEWNDWHDDAREGRRDQWGRKTESYDKHWEAIKEKDVKARLNRRDETKARRESKLKDDGGTSVNGTAIPGNQGPKGDLAPIGNLDQVSATDISSTPQTNSKASCMPPNSHAKVNPPGHESESEDDTTESDSDASSTKATLSPNTSVSGKSALRGGYGSPRRGDNYNLHEDFDKEYDDSDDESDTGSDNTDSEDDTDSESDADLKTDINSQRTHSRFGYGSRTRGITSRSSPLKAYASKHDYGTRGSPHSIETLQGSGSRLPRPFSRVGPFIGQQHGHNAGDKYRPRSPRPYARIGRSLSQATPQNPEYRQRSRCRDKSRQGSEYSRREKRSEPRSETESESDNDSAPESPCLNSLNDKPRHHLYMLLSVSPRASYADVVKAGKIARIRTHPDRKRADRTEIEKLNDQRLAAEVGEAVDTLTDPTKRRAYDEVQQKRRGP